MLNGTDISAYQAATVPAGDFVIIKATQGTGYINSKLAAQWLDATRKGLLRGAYHFPEYGNDPLADAKHFCDTIAPFLEPGDIVVLDHEAASPPSPAHAAAWGRTWLGDVQQRLHRRPWVYANLSFAAGGYCAGMGAYPYWCADPSSPAGKPRVRGPFKTWVAHQYAETGGIDRDVFNGSAADWRALGQPQQQEDDMASAVSLSASPGQTVPAGGDISIGWTGESTDRHGWVNKSDDGKAYSIYPDGPYWANALAWVRLSGLKAGDPIDLAWSLMAKDAKGNWIVGRDPWRVKFRGDGFGPQEFQLPGQFAVDKSTPVRVRIYSSLAYPLAVDNAAAEAAFLKY